jgi:uncharacterized membrane protein
MGRAIDMEKDIDSLKIKVERLENQLRGMVSKIDGIEEGLDEIYEESVEKEEVENETKKEKTNNEGNGKSSKSTDTAKSKSSKKSK